MRTFLLFLLLPLTLAVSSQVSAIPITVDGNIYNVTWKYGSYVTLVNEGYNFAASPWWGNVSKAVSFENEWTQCWEPQSCSPVRTGLVFPIELIGSGNNIWLHVIREDEVGGAQTWYTGLTEQDPEPFAIVPSMMPHKVPEPSTLAILTLGLCGINILRKVRRKRHSLLRLT